MRTLFIGALCYALCCTLTLQAQKSVSYPKLIKQLQDEGWHRKEIDRLLQTYIHESSGIGSKKDAAGTPLPVPNVNMLRDISQVHQWVEQYRLSYDNFEQVFPTSTEASDIVRAARLNPDSEVMRDRGLWKHVAMYSTSGRIYDLELNPEDPKEMYANPDGDGIFNTTDGGLTWKSITDNIPDRLHRNSYENIIVDPANFNHVFSISRYGRMYETEDGGEQWSFVKNENHDNNLAPQFKWVEAFRNNGGELILIGTVTKKHGLNHGWAPGVYRSVDQGKHWEQVDVEGEKFQELAFHSTNNDLIYLGSTSKLYKSINAGESFELLYDFDYGNQPMFIAPLSAQDSEGLYVVVSKGNQTQVHFSIDGGKTWELRQDSEKKIGYDKGIFGNGGSGGWISFFAVDPFNKDHLIASTVGTCESFDGGKNWEYQAWYTRALAQQKDGSRVLAPHGSHNADNHVLKFHPKKANFMVKGCDAGIMMKEKADTNWVNINGDMPAFLWYSVVVNEFGDRYVAGNTQDVNIQTYRYNKWENDRGYEGDAIFMNPSTNTTYYPVAKTEEGEGLNFLEPGFWKMHSWNHPKVAVNYYNLDQLYIAYGRRPIEKDPQLPKFLYVSNNRGISFQRVPNMNDKPVYSVNVSRTQPQVLTAFTETDVMQTITQGESWETLKYPEGFKGTQRNRKVSGCVDPVNPKRMWIGGDQGQIITTEDGGKNWNNITGSLPKGHILELLYHEGTAGDLYALVKGYGVFYKGTNDNDWKLWMKGFNLADFTEIRIDYPAQKLVASSYGRGLWQADLEQSVERFYSKGIKIKQHGNIFSVDSELQTPAYYNYNWTVNGESVTNNMNSLNVDRIKAGDVVEVSISPRYSSDVVTTTSLNVSQKARRGKLNDNEETLFLNDGFLDAGDIDIFGAKQNFTISVWVKPATAGVIAANRRTFYRDAKGWYLEITKEGKINFNAAFYQNRSLEKTFEKGVDQSIMVSSDDTEVKFNQWAHVVVTVDREKEITVYVNGQIVGTESLSNIPSDLSLNSVLNMTLFADSYGKKRMIGEMKNFVILKSAVSSADISGLSQNHKKAVDKVVYYIETKGAKGAVEALSGKKLIAKGEDYLSE
ncbi:hypothetical protein EYV94_04055 [Puteibacter caeruleilacunae]|nr:hypothetical protein EYV94_04055 [Puteibacter caeruleilacunae]